jgi:N-methylhydantoinase A
VLCALGDATTSKRSESARTVLRRFADLTGEDLRNILRELTANAGGRLAEQGVPEADQSPTYQVDVRYHGQGFEIGIDVDPAWLEDPDTALTSLAAAFDTEHERLFSFLLAADHELVNARATVSGPRPQVAPTHLPDGDGDPAAALVDTHPVHISGGAVDANVYHRAKLRAGDVITGPAIVIEMDSTTLVLPGHSAIVHVSGSLLINPVEG